MQVKDVMVHGAVTIDAGASVADAARLMHDQDVGMLIVTNDEKATGVVTDRDLLVKCIGEGDMPDVRPVRAYMTAPLISVSPHADVLDAARFLQSKHIQRLAVEDGGVLIGVVSYTDISQAMAQVMNDLLLGAGRVRRVPGAIEVGRVLHYYNKLGVAVLDLDVPIHKGDTLHFAGRATDFTQEVRSMEINHRQVDDAFVHDDVAVKVDGRVRTGDRVYREYEA
jgi:CBS domain-containing protein